MPRNVKQADFHCFVILNKQAFAPIIKRYSNNILRMTEEVMMVPTKEFDRLVQYYKGEITNNALWNKAGQLAAESHSVINHSRFDCHQEN